MDLKNNQNNLVPGQGQPLNLDKLKKLAIGQSLAAGQSVAHPAPARSRRFKRAGRAWAGALAFGACLSAAGAMVFLEKGLILETLALTAEQPGMPDEGLSEGEQEKYWALASFEPTRFPSLLGVRQTDNQRDEQNARKLQRLLSDQEHPGLR